MDDVLLLICQLEFKITPRHCPKPLAKPPPMQKAGDDGNVELQYHIRALGNSFVRIAIKPLNSSW
jgi:hypothetical protein